MPKSRPTTDFGPRLRQLRQARGWTQKQLAEHANTTVRSIVHYETAGRYPPAPAVAELAETLGVSMETLMGRKPPPTLNKPEELDLLNDPEDRKLWKKFRLLKELPRRDRQALIRMLNNMVDTKLTK